MKKILAIIITASISLPALSLTNQSSQAQNSHVYEYYKHKYNENGYDQNGYDRQGYDKNGYDKHGYDRQGYDKNFYNRKGYNKQGYDRQGYNILGYDKEGYDRQGFNSRGCDRKGRTRDGRDGTEMKNIRGDFICEQQKKEKNDNNYVPKGYDKEGYKKAKHNKLGCDREGLNSNNNPCMMYGKNGYDEEGYDRSGCDKNNLDRERNPCTKHKIKKEEKNKNNNEVKNYGKEAYDEIGFDQEGFDRSGYNRTGPVAASISEYRSSSRTLNPEDRIPQKGNTVLVSKEEPVSTFSIDVDSGSYDLYRSEINRISDPEYIQKIDKTIRIEEFINAFDYNYSKPESIENPFNTNFEIIDSPWSDNNILKIGIQGYEANLKNTAPINLVFLIDTSGSMSEEISLIRNMLNKFSENLRDNDRISIVTYAGHTSLHLENTEAKNIEKIKAAINLLSSNGSTNGESGIIMAYEQAKSGYIENGINRVILMSDGDFNVGQTDSGTLEDMIKDKRKSGIEFSTVGLNTRGNGYNDHLMEKMSNVGNGHYIFIGDAIDAQNFTSNIVKSLVTIAKDVKIQIEFNPEKIKEYRLIGYENRKLNKEDFNNDNIDAGDLMSGSNVTALYEVTFKGEDGLVDDLRYERKDTAKAETMDEFAHLKLRYKKPNNNESELITFPVKKESINKKPTSDTNFALSVAGFAQLLRNEPYISNEYNFEDVLKSAQNNKGDDYDGQRAKFIDVVKIRKSIEN